MCQEQSRYDKMKQRSDGGKIEDTTLLIACREPLHHASDHIISEKTLGLGLDCVPAKFSPSCSRILSAGSCSSVVISGSSCEGE